MDVGDAELEREVDEELEVMDDEEDYNEDKEDD